MSKFEASVKPYSLTQHFEAPDEFVGLFGWMCGYSADAVFINEAVERFTRQSRGQRAHNGTAALVLLLDPGNPCLTFCDVPGVVHLAIQNLTDKPFVLLHAKVAILGFRHPTDPNQWRLRLLVSTGNWTRQTLEESLDLAWCIDVSSEDLVAMDVSTIQACADFKAASDMFAWLKPYFDSRILEASPIGVEQDKATTPSALFDSWLAKVVGKGRRAKPRFFTSIKASLLNQLPDLINNAGLNAADEPIKRNVLAMGSGFYEAASEGNSVPTVLREIVATLKKEKLVRPTVKPDIFVNDTACQAVAHCLPGLADNGFSVRSAQAPERLFGKDSQRFLHAKFIFSANRRAGSSTCNNAWLYMGSGNLTGPGFSRKASKNGGNFEAGVVFAPEGLHWVREKGKATDPVVTDLLPLQWDTEFSVGQDLKAGSEMEQRDVQYLAAPVAWLHWCEDASGAWLQTPEDTKYALAVLDDTGAAHRVDDFGRVFWSGPCPREVTLMWSHEGTDHRAIIPVLDESGRIAGAALPKLGLDEAWWQLVNFPLPPDEEDIVGQEREATLGPDPLPPGKVAHAPSATYPIRQMMELIENIADKQTHLSMLDWTAWCTRLEQCLLQAAESQVLKAFVRFQLNPISPLWHAPFRPTFAENRNSAPGLRYEAVLQRVEHAWGVGSLDELGVKDA